MRAVPATGAAIAPRPPGRTDLPLSWGQERLWFLQEPQPDDTAYQIFVARRLRGPLDTGVLIGALSDLVARHESLRTRFPAIGGTPVQVVDPPPPVALELIDLAHVLTERRERQARDLLVERIETPFDLGEGPLLRAVLVRLAADDHVLCLVVHHIVADDWSLSLLCDELGAFYRAALRAEDPVLPPLPVQYADYALWQRAGSEEPDAGQVDYWTGRLAGAPALDLRKSRPRPLVRGSRGATVRRHLPAELCAAVFRLAQARRATLFMTVLAAYQAVLARHSGLDDICVGAPVSLRDELELEPVIGLFVNTLVLRGDLSDDPTFVELLDRTRALAVEAYAHAGLPFDRLVQALDVPRDLSRTPVFQTMFRLDPGDRVPLRLGDAVEVTPFELEHRTAHVELTLEVTWAADGAKAEFVYDRDLFDASAVEALAQDLAEVLAAVCADPDARLSDLGIIAPTRPACPSFGRTAGVRRQLGAPGG